MKDEQEIKRQLEEIYEYRLSLRIDRKTKRMCRNCVYGVCREFDLGDFGTMSRWECRDGIAKNDECKFSCRWSKEQIEQEMINDIADPSVCGAKEPKIAMLMWVLHGKSENKPSGDEKKDGADSLWGKLKEFFK